MKIFQQMLQLRERKRGFHLITAEVVNALPQIHELKPAFARYLSSTHQLH